MGVGALKHMESYRLPIPAQNILQVPVSTYYKCVILGIAVNKNNVIYAIILQENNSLV